MDETNLEVAPETDDGILFINEYLYENDLLANFARLEAEGGRKTLLAIVAAIAFVWGVWFLIAGGEWAWLGIAGIAIGAFLLWRRRHLRHFFAARYIDAMEKDPTSFGDRYRRIAVAPEGLMVFARDGRSRYYRFSDLTRVRQDDLMHVLVFGGDGVCVPRDTFVRGDDRAFEEFVATIRHERRGR